MQREKEGRCGAVAARLLLGDRSQATRERASPQVYRPHTDSVRAVNMERRPEPAVGVRRPRNQIGISPPKKKRQLSPGLVTGEKRRGIRGRNGPDGRGWPGGLASCWRQGRRGPEAQDRLETGGDGSRGRDGTVTDRAGGESVYRGCMVEVASLDSEPLHGVQNEAVFRSDVPVIIGIFARPQNGARFEPSHMRSNLVSPRTDFSPPEASF
jgi:hypothetical protein